MSLKTRIRDTHCLAHQRGRVPPLRRAGRGTGGGLLLLFLFACQNPAPPREVARVETPAVDASSQVVPPAPVEEKAQEAPKVAATGCGLWKARTLGQKAPGDAILPQGIASAGVRAQSAIVWAASDRVVKLRALYSEGPDCPTLHTEYLQTRKKDGYTLHFSIDGLKPGTLYQYRVEAENGEGPSSPGWFSTAPVGDVPVRLAFSADVAGFAAEVRLLDQLVATGPDLYLSLGDWPYTDLLKDATNPIEFRVHYRASRTGERVERVTRSMPIHAVWDDHEITNDWDARFGKWHGRRLEAGIKVWREWWPVAGAPQGEIYRHYRWGRGLEIFHLDTRKNRDSNAAPTKGKSMLGKAQRDWLLDGLSKSEATFKLVITSVPLDYGKTAKDMWHGFQEERGIILDHIRDRAIPGVVFLAGDQHWYASHHLPVGVREWQTGPLAFTAYNPVEPKHRDVVVQGKGRNFGVIEYKPGAPATLTFIVHLEAKGEVYREVLRAGVGQIKVKASSPKQRWHLSGAHSFHGRGDAELKLAPTGSYTIKWSEPEAPPKTLQLPEGGAILLSH